MQRYWWAGWLRKEGETEKRPQVDKRVESAEKETSLVTAEEHWMQQA